MCTYVDVFIDNIIKQNTHTTIILMCSIRYHIQIFIDDLFIDKLQQTIKNNTILPIFTEYIVHMLSYP